jgi:hypothetical protein
VPFGFAREERVNGSSQDGMLDARFRGHDGKVRCDRPYHAVNGDGYRAARRRWLAAACLPPVSPPLIFVAWVRLSRTHHKAAALEIKFARQDGRTGQRAA